MSLSNKAKQQILRQRMRAMFPYFIEIENEDFGTFRYVNADNDIEYGGQVYEACYFSIQPPDRTETKIGDGTLTFSEIYGTGEWVRKIRSSDKRGTLRIVAAIIYSADNIVDGIEPIYDSDYILSDASWDNDSREIKIVFKFDEGMDINMPCDKLDEIICPGAV